MRAATPRPLAALIALAGLLAPAARAGAPEGWWNPAWSHRTHVRVRLAPCEPLGFRYRPPTAGEDLVAAEARFPCPVKLQGTAQQEVRVLDAGGNLLPCVADGPDARGLLTVTFPARRTIAGQLAAPIQDGTKTVTLSVGADKAVTPGMRFYALAGAGRIATLEVASVAQKTSEATIVDKTTPNIAQGIPIESDVLTSTDYFIYCGNPKPEGEAPRWTPRTSTVNLYGWRVTDGALLTALEEARGTYRKVPVEQVRAALRNSPAFAGAAALTQIDNRANPLDYEGAYHLSVYESFVYCDIAGHWRFSVDSAAPAYLFLDGKFTAQRPSFFYQVAGNFEHRGKIELAQGYHHLLLIAAETGKQNTRLGWQRPIDTVFELVPPSFFVNRIAAELVALETRAQDSQVFFTYELAPLSVVAENGKRYQFIQFRNLSRLGPETGVAYSWDFGNGAQSREVSPGCLFEVPAGAAAPGFPVTLQARVGDKPAGQHQQTVYCDPRPTEKLNLSLDIVSFSNIVYYDERTSIAIRLRNTGFSPVIVRATGRLENRDGRQIIVSQDLRINGKDENFCILPVDMKELPDKTALLDLDVRLGTQTVLETAARIVPFTALSTPGAVAIQDGQLVLGPGGPYTGIAWTGDFPALNYEVLLNVQGRAGHDLCQITFPVGSAHCTLRPRAWDLRFLPGRWHEIRLRVTDAKVEAWLDGKPVADVPRAKAEAALPLAFDALTPFGLHAALSAQVALRKVALTRLPPASAPAPDGQQPPPATDLFDGSLRNWKAVAETDLNLLQRGLGSLHDYLGRRVMLASEIEDADRHLEWVFARWFRDRHLARHRRILLLGDRMAGPPQPGQKLDDYVALLEHSLANSGRAFQFVQRTTGLLPTLPDIILLARTLAALRPLPDVIVLSPGLADVQQAVGERDFARSFDLMIDAVRATGKPIKILIVSPPPCPRNVRLSRLYTDAAARVARQHHVGYLDLHALLAPEGADWLEACYAAPSAEGLYLDTPNQAAHRRIAEAIAGHIKP